MNSFQGDADWKGEREQGVAGGIAGKIDGPVGMMQMAFLFDWNLNGWDKDSLSVVF